MSLQCARQGFALGLTILLGAITSIRVDAILKLIVDLLEVSSSMKGKVGKSFFTVHVGCPSVLGNCLIAQCIATGCERLFFGAAICLWSCCTIRKVNCWKLSFHQRVYQFSYCPCIQEAVFAGACCLNHFGFGWKGILDDYILVLFLRVVWWEILFSAVWLKTQTITVLVLTEIIWFWTHTNATRKFHYKQRR